MDKLKICMVGGSAVGKTSLVSRFVDRVFEERYSSTIGVRIQARRILRGDRAVSLVLWDLNGDDEFQRVQTAYLHGAAGYLLVVDGTRRQTLDTAIELEARMRAVLGPLPFVVVLNKADLRASWELPAESLLRLSQLGWRTVLTSAKTGANVEDAFRQLVDDVLARRGETWTSPP